MKKMGEPARQLDGRYTYGDYRTWPPDERWELIEGIAWAMSPAPGRKHQDVTGEIFTRLKNFLAGKSCRVYIAPFDILFPDSPDQDEDEAPTVVQPDITVYCDGTKVRERGGLGAPDLVVEVLSPWTQKKDFNEKLNLYERHGVREYWIVDPGNRSVLVFRIGPGGAYGEPFVLVPPSALDSAVLPGFSVDLETLFSFE
jgi:Uma2 family endonuclease